MSYIKVLRSFDEDSYPVFSLSDDGRRYGRIWVLLEIHTKSSVYGTFFFESLESAVSFWNDNKNKFK